MTDSKAANSSDAPRGEFARRVTIAVLITFGLAVLVLLLWYTIYVFLLAFAGILFAVLLRAMADGVSFVTRLPRGWALALTSVLLIGLIVGGSWLLTPRVAVQVEQLRETLPSAMQELGEFFSQYQWAQIFMDEGRRVLDDVGDMSDAWPTLASGAATALAATSTMIVGIVVAFFIGVFLAINPGIYVRGFVRLVPPRNRARAVVLLEATEGTLRWWLIGRIMAMAFVGICTAVTLWALGVPLSLTLGLLAALLDFVPNVGPMIALVPAIVIAFGEGPDTALYVLIAYFVIQQLESYVITPIIQQKVVSLPPAFTVFIQVLFVILAGPLGLLLATPLAAAGLVMVRGLYVQDVLGDKDIGLTD